MGLYFRNINSEKFSNAYCSVYCREWVEYSFPDENLEVLAGTHFVLGEPYIPNGPSNFVLPKLSPITVTGNSLCRVKNDTINYARFQRDYQNANNAVQTAWNNYQVAQAKLKAWETITIATTYGNCVSVNQETGETTITGTYTLQRFTSGVGKYGEYSTTLESWNRKTGCSSNGGKTKAEKKTQIESQIATAKAEYDSAVKKRESILKQIKDCNNFIYKNAAFEPSLSFEYEENMYGSDKTFDLKANESIDVLTKYYDTNDKKVKEINDNGFPSDYFDLNINTDFLTSSSLYGNVSTISTYDCGTEGKHCTSSNTEYPSNAWLRQKTVKTYSYTLGDSVYGNVAKPSGESYNFSNEIGSVIKNELGYSNLPIHYSRQEGTYDYKITINSLGNNYKFNRYLSSQADKEYLCQYNVVNNIMDQKDDRTLVGVNVIFRPISLDDPFPSIDGDGRTTGANWCNTEIDTENGCVNTNSVVTNVITNNRGVITEEVYRELDPLYRITLTPALIKEVRNYNDSQERTVSNEGYLDFNLTCDEDGKKCKSNFIRNEFSNYFSGCGISRVGLDCSNNDTW